ncbi:hypothetical protein EDB92DRAFT_221423 [Lactarius akahatsu]|uniref:Uncharacterized protein n=1 Tax=Lactarius akahatsu TaxID=416441 RepID=A0AAD4L5J5_9AGAM|nr:hypothetical protein EDB92DRAFT_221423 [Lactarius akahatsu]
MAQVLIGAASQRSPPFLEASFRVVFQITAGRTNIMPLTVPMRLLSGLQKHFSHGAVVKGDAGPREVPPATTPVCCWFTGPSGVRSHVRSSRSRSYFKGQLVFPWSMVLHVASCASLTLRYLLFHPFVQERQFWTRDLCFHCLTLPCSFSLLLRCTAVTVRWTYLRCRWPLVCLGACTSAYTHSVTLWYGHSIKTKRNKHHFPGNGYTLGYTSPWNASR